MVRLTIQSMIEHEFSLHAQGMQVIAGVDEVGRGALAGPLAAAAVVLPPLADILGDPFWTHIHDSKTIAEPERVRLAMGIRERALSTHVALIPPGVIDVVGVGPANRMAMEAAIQGIAYPPEIVLLDAFVTDLGIPQVSFIRGDGSCLSIAAASIVAKVARDQLMHELDVEYAMFGFGRHKGYGVASHLAALLEHGPCAAHRFCFGPVLHARARHRTRA